MSITTMESLSEVTEGQLIYVRGNPRQHWKRVPEGFECDGINLGIEMFEGAVRSGLVSVGAEPRRGQWWTEPSSPLVRYLLVDHTGEEWWVAIFYGDDFSEVRKMPSVPGQYDESLGAEMPTTPWSMARHMVRLKVAHEQEHARNRRLAESNEALQRAQQTVRPDFNREAFAERMRNLLDENDEPFDSEYDDLLDAYGLGGRNQEVEVEATIDGSTEIDLSEMTATNLAPGGVSATGGEADIKWTRTITAEFEGRGCQCHRIDNAYVIQVLSDEEVDYDDFEITEVSCDHC